MFDSDFVEESLEFIEESETLLLGLEGRLASIKDKNQLSTILAPFMRCLHSLKGASSMYGLTAIVDYTHHLEQQVIKEIPVLKNEHIAMYLQELDKLRNVFEFQDMNYLTKTEPSPKLSPAPEVPPMQSKHSDEIQAKEEVVKLPPSAPTKKTTIINEEKKVEVELKPKIAFIDDEEFIHEIFVHGCRDQNWEIDSYVDPTQISNFQQYDLLIVDYIMPGINGLELIEKIRLKHHKLPIILLSGFVTKDLCLKAFQFEHVIVVEKSASLDLLILNAGQQVEKYQAYKLLGKSLDLIKYHFGDLHVYLKSQGLQRLSDSIIKDIQNLERERKKLRI